MLMGMGCEPEVYDPMEKAMLQYCGGTGNQREGNLLGGSPAKEYAFTNGKMMEAMYGCGMKADSQAFQRFTGEGGGHLQR